MYEAFRARIAEVERANRAWKLLNLLTATVLGLCVWVGQHRDTAMAARYQDLLGKVSSLEIRLSAARTEAAGVLRDLAGQRRSHTPPEANGARSRMPLVSEDGSD